MRQHVDSVSSLEGAECPRPSALSMSRNSMLTKSNISADLNFLSKCFSFNSRRKFHYNNYVVGDDEASEREIMKELVFCMQGIEGKIIKYKSVDEGFYLNPQVSK